MASGNPRQYLPTRFVEKCGVLIFHGPRVIATDTTSGHTYKFKHVQIAHDLETWTELSANNPYGFDLQFPAAVHHPNNTLEETAKAIALEAGGPSTQLLEYTCSRLVPAHHELPFLNDEPVRRRFRGCTEPFMFTVRESSAGVATLTRWYLAYNWSPPLSLEESPFRLQFDTTLETFAAAEVLLKEEGEKEVLRRAVLVLGQMGMVAAEESGTQ